MSPFQSILIVKLLFESHLLARPEANSDTSPTLLASVPKHPLPLYLRHWLWYNVGIHWGFWKCPTDSCLVLGFPVKERGKESHWFDDYDCCLLKFPEKSMFVTLIQFMWFRDEMKLWPAAGNGFDFSFLSLNKLMNTFSKFPAVEGRKQYYGRQSRWWFVFGILWNVSMAVCSGRKEH